MRQNELQLGIDVEDEHGNVLGTSQVAAKKVNTNSLFWFNSLSKKTFLFAFCGGAI